MERLSVVKVGGAILEDSSKLEHLIDSFAALQGPRILVHGGGRLATDVSRKLGIETRMIDGRRVTDDETLEVVTMVYGGLVNKKVVALLQAKGVNSLGLTGADMNLIRSRRRPPVDGIDFGNVGDVEAVNRQSIISLLDEGIVPVFSPITYDGKGNLLNTNADTIAASVARSLADHFEVRLIYCFEQDGVMTDSGNEQRVIERIGPGTFESLVERGVITGGMIPKVKNALDAVGAGVKEVRITRFDMISDTQSGTVISI